MLPARVESFIARHRLVEPGNFLVVAVSGGADSLCLLLVLHELATRLDVRLHVAHLDHMLRPDATADAAFVAGVARDLGVPATVEARDVRAVQRAEGLSLEAAARRVRYAFLQEVAEETGAAAAAVAHTSDDQAETVLLHFLRGSGLAGLRGMTPKSTLRLPGSSAPLRVIRPLLEVERRETEQYCQAHGYEPRQDPSNQSLEFTRNRIRLDLIPHLEASYNPAIRRTLIRTARAAADDFDFLIGQVDRVWPEVVHEQPSAVELEIAGVRALPRALQRHLLRRAFAAVAGEEEISARHVERLMAELERPRAGVELHLPGGVVFTTSYQTAALQHPKRSGNIPEQAPLPDLVEGSLNVPGTTFLGAWRIDAEVEAAPAERQPDPWVARLDFDQAGAGLRVRRRRIGDRFQPLGLGTPKRLQDFFVDAKVPRAWRASVPIVESPAGIIWVAGWRIDERFKVTPATRTILKVEFRRHDVCD